MKTKLSRSLIQICLLAAALLVLPAAAQAQFTYTTNNGMITITGYTGSGGAVSIPATINGLPVTSIGDDAFANSGLTSVTIPDSVTNIGDRAFYDCWLLTGVFIAANAPSAGDSMFEVFNGVFSDFPFPEDVTVYYLSNTTGWSNTFAGFPTMMLDGSAQFGTTTDGWNYVSDQVKNTLITGYAGSSNAVVIPSTINDLPVTGIAPYAFKDNPSLISVYGFFLNNSSLTSVTIPNSVTSIGAGAFFTCFNLNSVYFSGNAPSISEYAFEGENPTIYYVFGTSGWSSMFAGFATALWDPPTCLEYAINDGAVTIISYAGSGGTVSIPPTINGLPVNSIGNVAFYDDNSFNDNSLISVTIPDSVTNIGDSAFVGCINLTSLYFGGNAPVADSSAFVIYGYPYYDPATVYYLPGTLGWSNTFAGLPTAPWFLPQPVILNQGPGFGMQSNQFGFTISWATNVPVVVEACSNLSSPVWLLVSTNNLVGGTSHFSDPQSSNYPARFYRLRSP